MTGHAKPSAVDIDVDMLMRLRLLCANNYLKRAGAALPTASLFSRKRGRGIEPHDVRPWLDGDDVRTLDHNVTARTGTPHVRNFHEENSHNTLYFIDLRPSMYFGTRRTFRAVAAIEAIIISAWRTLDLNGSVGIVIATSQETRLIGWAHSRRSFSAMLHEIVAIYRDGNNKFDAVDPYLCQSLTLIEKLGGSAPIIIATGFDQPGDNFDMFVKRIAKRREITFILISDPFERAPPSGNYPYHTPDGLAGQIFIKREENNKKNDIFSMRLRQIGARALSINIEDTTPVTASVLERIFDGSR